MIKSAKKLLLAFCCFLALLSSRGAEVIINEIMYRPPVETNKEEYIELFNAGTNAVDLAGWRFTTGIRFAFTNPTILPPGGHLVVVQHTPTFTNKYPGVGNFVGDWDGILSNSSQLIELVDASGQRADSVRYSDEGDWARRVKGPIDYGHRGWEWGSEADGGGKSLELMNPDLSNKCGQNWAPSTVPDGTPGRANSVSSGNIAPLILDAEHFPLVPKSTESVAIRARIVDESTNGLAVAVHHRVDGKASFTVTAMADDGLHGDGAPGDGVYGALLPPQTNDTIVEFYFEARDAGSHTRIWPAPALIDGAPAQAANLLYQVDDSVYGGAQPLYRLILTAADQAELSQINRNSPPPPCPNNDQTRSHAEMNGTFISLDGTGVACRYNVGIRNRGNGSRNLGRKIIG